MRLHTLLAAGILLATSLVARADSLIDYSVNGTLADGATFSGNVDYDPTSQLFVSGQIIEFGTSGGVDFDKFIGSAVRGTGLFAFIDNSDDTQQFTLGILTSELQAGSLNGQVCSDAHPCVFVSGNNVVGDVAVNGTYSATPEPSSVALFGVTLAVPDAEAG